MKNHSNAIGQSRPTAELHTVYVKHSWGLKTCKRLFDIVISLIFFAAFGWLYLLLWVGVRISSGGPSLYSQPRYGRNGEVFNFYKFRSMVQNSQEVLDEYLLNNPVAREQWNVFQKLENDPRINKFGSFIRKTSLDELPQFWNVLIGDMSLIGPRPCMLNQRELYGSRWAYYCAVRPGITGLWQVSGRNNLTYAKRVALDVEYVEQLSLQTELNILIKTVWVVAIGHGSR